MHRAREFRLEHVIDFPLPLHPTHPCEGGGDDGDSEMAFPALPRARVAVMPVRLVLDLEALRLEGGLKLAADGIGDAHGNISRAILYRG